MRGRRSAAPAARGAAARLTEQALRRFVRGGTWPGLAREIAWHAAIGSGADEECLTWLPDLVQQRLAEQVEGLEVAAARGCADGAHAHLRAWPHDHGGSETAARLEGRERVERELAQVYLSTLEWALDLLDERTRVRPRRRPRLPFARPERVDPPAAVRELAEPPRRYGWSDRPSSA